MYNNGRALELAHGGYCNGVDEWIVDREGCLIRIPRKLNAQTKIAKESADVVNKR